MASARSVESVHKGVLVECAACQNGNPRDRRFCATCGATLWQKCLKCSAECASTETFCGSCGSNLKELIQKRIADVEAAVARAESLRAGDQRIEGIRLLRALPDAAHPLIAPAIEQARRLASELDREQRELEEQVANAIQQAERAMEATQYKEVIKWLQPFPASYLGESGQRLLSRAASYYEEVKKLRAEIAAEVEARRFLLLGPKIERYLALQPGEEKVRELSRKVGEFVCKRVREALQACEHEKAYQLLQQVPLSAHSDEVKLLTAEVVELNRLNYEIQSAAIADKSLLAIVERMRKLAPTVERYATARESLLTKIKQTPTDPRFPLVDWAPVPQRTNIGLPVKLLAGFRRLRASNQDVASQLTNRPGQFFVACGLALQGLGKARLTSNVANDGKAGLLSKLSLFKNKKPVSAAWGLDIGGSALKVVRLVIDEKGKVVIDSCDAIPFDHNLNQLGAELTGSESIGQALRAFQDKFQPAEDEPLCANAPNARIITRFFSVPLAKQKKLSEIIQYEASHQIPVPLAELSWSYDILGETTGDEEATSEFDSLQSVMLIALRSNEVKDRLYHFEQLGLRLQLMQADGAALHNFLAYDEFEASPHAAPAESSPPEKATATSPTLALLDVGSDSSTLLISSQNHTWFRTIRVGGNDVSQALTRDLKLTFDQAEELKRSPGRARRISALLESCEPALVRIGSEVQRTLESYATEYPSHQIDALWLCGGGSSQYGLIRYLRSGSPNY